jgi:TonB family protein
VSNTQQFASVNVPAHGHRQYPRRSVNALGCIYLSGDSGGVVMNVSEGGLAVYSAVIPDLEAMPFLRFQLPQSSDWIKARGKLAWSRETKHGIQFIELPDNARKQIREWIGSQNVAEASVESSRLERRPQAPAVSALATDCAGAIGDVAPAPNGASDTLESRLRSLFAQREAMRALAEASEKKTPWARVALLCALAGVSLLLGLAAARGKFRPLVAFFTKASDSASAPSAAEASSDGTNEAPSHAAAGADASAASSEIKAEAPRITVTNQIHVPVSYAQDQTSKKQNLQIGRVNHRVDPQYPPQAISKGIEGSVQLRASISAAGAVQSVSVLGGPTMLTSSAVDAVRSWRYTPTLLDGKPVATEADIAIVFWLPADSKANRPKD